MTRIVRNATIEILTLVIHFCTPKKWFYDNIYIIIIIWILRDGSNYYREMNIEWYEINFNFVSTNGDKVWYDFCSSSTTIIVTDNC